MSKAFQNMTIKKAIGFLALVTLLEIVLRKGMFPFPLPIPIPSEYMVICMFSLFTVFVWLITKWFSKSDKMKLVDLGVSFNAKNRKDFFYGFLIGAIVWGLVSIIQSLTADFTWVFRPNLSWYNIIYGLIFIFIADLGTELYTRAYPLNGLKNSFGSKVAIIIMVFFVSLKSYTASAQGELLLYIILIPALHTIFFSIIYFKTKRLGGALGVHVGANFITISIFDLRIEQPGQATPSGIFQPNTDIETLSLTALQMPWVLMAIFFSVAVYFFFERRERLGK